MTSLLRPALFFAAALAACAHTADPGVRAIIAVPDGATTSVIEARDGTKLVVLRWAAKTETPRGTLVVVHGLKDYAERYAAFASKLAERGYAVIAFDLRGHGHSAGPRVAPDPWRDYVDDLARVIDIAKAETTAPVFVFGHSMGGAIATLATLDAREKVAGLILSAPALAIASPPLLIAATRMAGALTPNAKALDLPNAEFSSDPAATKVMNADAYVEQGPSPARTAAGLVDGIGEIWARTEELSLPLLALHGTRDSITAPSGSRELVRAARSTDKTLRIYEGYYHDLLHEPRGARVADDILAWLDAHTGGDAVVTPPIFPGRLRGEPGEWTQAVAISAGVHGLDDDVGFAGLASVQLAKLRPLGWHGAITAQLLGDFKAASLRPIGLAVRAGGAALGVSGGIAAITDKNIALSFGAFGEVGVGPAHVSLLAERARGIQNTNDHGPLASDLLLTAISLRFGGDRTYWPHAVAGVGPIATGGITWTGSAPSDWFLTLGLQLYGAD